MGTIREELLRLYGTRHVDFKTVRMQFPNDDMAGPFIMSPSDSYITQPFPLLIVGQETNGWTYYVDNIEKQMAVYSSFNVGEKYYASPFWNVTRKVERALGNSSYSCSWSNISKFDLKAGRSRGEHERVISTLDNIILEEIQILKPKVCVFFTGPTFDVRLTKVFADIKFTPLINTHLRECAQLRHPLLPTLTFRTYHPNYLRRSGKESRFIELMKSIGSSATLNSAL